MTNLQAVDSPHLNVKQLAKRWHKTPQAIYSMRHRGDAPQGFKRGREVLFPLVQVEAFEAALMAADEPSNRRSGESHRPAEPRRAARRRTPRPATSAA